MHNTYIYIYICIYIHMYVHMYVHMYDTTPEELFHNLSENVFQKPKVGHRVFKVGFLQSIFGKPYSGTAFAQVLQVCVVERDSIR